jgi:hypothetical protein
MLSDDAVAKVYSVGCAQLARTPFLWCVNVVYALPKRRSQSLTFESCEPVMTCGSTLWVRTLDTVFVWPARQKISSFVRISQTWGCKGVRGPDMHPRGGVAATCDEYVEGGVEGDAIHAAQMAMVVAHNFVLL